MSKPTPIIDLILERYPDEEFLKVDDLDDAIIGVDSLSMKLVYSVKKCIELLAAQMDVSEDELDEDETIESKKHHLAIEHFEYNIKNSYVGEKTPIYCEDDFYF
jgi:hypothetical protein